MVIRDAIAWCLTGYCLWANLHGATPPEPKIVGDATVLVDRITGVGRQKITLRNDSATVLSLSLSTNINATKPSKIMVHLDQPKLALKPNAAGEVEVVATEVRDAGDTPVDLLDSDTKIGTIKIRLLPFTVKLDGPTPDKADLLLLNDVETRIMLKNDDPVEYRLDWQLFLDGMILCSGSQVAVDPNGYGMLICNPHNIPARFRHLLKDETLTGKLSIGLRDLSHYPPTKVFDITAGTYVLSQGTRSFFRYLLTFIVLACGGLFSLFLNQTLPNQLQKLNLQDQLLAIGKTTADLSSHVDSRLAVLVRIERAKLRDLLKWRSTVFPDFGAIATQVSDALTKLTSRVKLLQQMDLVIGRLGKITPCGAPPSLVTQANDSLGAATVLLGKADFTDPDLLGAQTAVNTASALVDSLANPGADFGQKLAQRIEAAAADIPKLVSKPSFARLHAVVPGPVTEVTGAAALGSTIPAALYVSLDMALSKLLLMHDYAVLAEGTQDKEMLSRLSGKEKDLTDYLQLGSWEALCFARLLMREMKEDIYPKRLRDGLEAGEAAIVLDPAIVYGSAPLIFSMAFRNKAVNEAAAREEWTCNWDFGDGLTGSGWEVSHYYDLALVTERRRRQEAGKAEAGAPGAKGEAPKSAEVNVTITATFQDEKGRDVTKTGSADLITVTREVTVKPSIAPKSWERTWTEGLKLSAALLIAVFGLVAGAGDQLAKLDVMPALVAVFLLGFGADTIKNVFSPKTS